MSLEKKQSLHKILSKYYLNKSGKPNQKPYPFSEITKSKDDMKKAKSSFRNMRQMENRLKNLYKDISEK